MISAGGSFDASLNEPPCRQRRLEPWRRQIREKCRAEADAHCSPRSIEEEEEDELSRLFGNTIRNRVGSNPTHELVTPMESSLLDLSREMDSFFDSVFASRPVSQQQREQEEDPFENIFNSMMGFSLRAFDEMAAMDSGSSSNNVPQIPLPPVKVVDPAVEVVDLDEEKSMEGDEEFEGDSYDGEWTEGEEDDDEIEENVIMTWEEGEFGAVPAGSDYYNLEGKWEPGDEEEEEEPITETLAAVFGHDVSNEDNHEGLDWEEAEEEDAIPAPPSPEEYGGFDVDPEEAKAAPPLEGESPSVNREVEIVPEEAAESFLDFMVASLAQRSAAAAASAAAQQQEQENSAEGVEEVGLPSVHDLPDHLFRLGSDLLTEVRTHRRLQEGPEKDTRLHAKERLARRLTEYRTDLFIDPTDGTITIYTTGSGMSGGGPSPFMMMPSFPLLGGTMMGGMMMDNAPPARSQLGMGSRELDDCMSSRFDNGDLDDECHEAVNTFYLAVEDREMIPPMMSEDMRNLEHFHTNVDVTTTVVKIEPHQMGGCSFVFWGMMLLTVAIMLDNYFNSEDEEDEEDDANEFDYTELPEDDKDNERVFVGVPVQVV